MCRFIFWLCYEFQFGKILCRILIWTCDCTCNNNAIHVISNIGQLSFGFSVNIFGKTLSFIEVEIKRSWISFFIAMNACLINVNCCRFDVLSAFLCLSLHSIPNSTDFDQSCRNKFTNFYLEIHAHTHTCVRVFMCAAFCVSIWLWNQLD